MQSIWRLGVDEHHHGKGIVQDLSVGIRIAFGRELSYKVGLFAVVETKHAKAKTFYAKLGLIERLDNPMCLYRSVATLERSIVQQQKSVDIEL